MREGRGESMIHGQNSSGREKAVFQVASLKLHRRSGTCTRPRKMDRSQRVNSKGRSSRCPEWEWSQGEKVQFVECGHHQKQRKGENGKVSGSQVVEHLDQTSGPRV